MDYLSLLNIVILAAGRGKRMHSDKPKVLHTLAGRPLLQHVLDTAAQCSADTTCVVYGHGGEAVPQAMAQSAARFVLQEPQLGTGHAVQQALPLLAKEGLVLVLYGDVPLTQAATLKKMLAQPDALTLLTHQVSDPTGYGRIVRDSSGKVKSIVEEKDAAPEQRAITEVNTGILAAPHTLAAHLAGSAAKQQCPARILPDRHRRNGSCAGGGGTYGAARPCMGGHGDQQQSATG